MLGIRSQISIPHRALIVKTSDVDPGWYLRSGTVAALVATAAKWLLVGRIRTATHPLWSSFVWRNELYDTFVEQLAVPWLLADALGTPLLTCRLRSAVLQTHLFHDRLMRLGPVRLGAGATLGPHGIVLPDTTVEPGATIGPLSLAMRGETIPAAFAGWAIPSAPGSTMTPHNEVPTTTSGA
jgi:hypothetical protein